MQDTLHFEQWFSVWCSLLWFVILYSFQKHKMNPNTILSCWPKRCFTNIQGGNKFRFSGSTPLKRAISTIQYLHYTVWNLQIYCDWTQLPRQSLSDLLHLPANGTILEYLCILRSQKLSQIEQAWVFIIWRKRNWFASPYTYICILVYRKLLITWKSQLSRS